MATGQRKWSAQPVGGFCTHLVDRDHHMGRDKKGRPYWLCSKCRAVGLWEPGWLYYGNYECRVCCRAVVEWVRCPKCRPPNAKIIDGRALDG